MIVIISLINSKTAVKSSTGGIQYITQYLRLHRPDVLAAFLIRCTSGCVVGYDVKFLLKHKLDIRACELNMVIVSRSFQEWCLMG